MNPFQKFRHYFLGKAMSQADDVFEKAKIDLLFSFSVFFLIFATIFSILSFDKNGFSIFLSIFGALMLLATIVTLKVTGRLMWAAYIYLANQTIQTVCHFMLGDGHLEMQAVCWMLLYAIFGFLVMGRNWGLFFMFIISCIVIFALVDEASGFKYYKYPGYLAQDTSNPYAVMMPIALIIFLISQFVRAERIAQERIKKQNTAFENNCRQLETKNKDITDSINYAKKIQYAVLPQEETIYRSIPLSFILYKPRDIVSGDFFWFHEIDRDNYIIVCADCTGHGVPGAMMTVVGSSLLNQIIVDSKITKPSEILLELDKRITQTLKQEKERLYTIHDGMDLALLKVDKAKKEFTFTSAKRPAVFIRNKQLQEFKGSKFTLGGMRTGEKKFEEIKMNYEEDDMIYFFTDGYTDQFGGPKGKKFSVKQLRELLLHVHQFSSNEQKQKLESAIENWKGSYEQVDDIQMMGIRF